MTNVVPFDPESTAVPAAGVPQSDVIEALEWLLERARSGEVQTVAVAFMDKDSLASWRVQGLVGGYSFLGAVDMLHHALREMMP